MLLHNQHYIRLVFCSRRGGTLVCYVLYHGLRRESVICFFEGTLDLGILEFLSRLVVLRRLEFESAGVAWRSRFAFVCRDKKTDIGDRENCLVLRPDEVRAGGERWCFKWSDQPHNSLLSSSPLVFSLQQTTTQRQINNPQNLFIRDQTGRQST